MEKRLFQIIDDMNLKDVEEKTVLVSVSSNFISADMIKQGGKICMGVARSDFMDLMNEKRIPVLLLLDKEDYFKRQEANKT